MRFSFVRPSQYSQWGGDVKAILDSQEGLRDLGHGSFLMDDVRAALHAEQIFFMGTLLDQSPHFHLMHLLGRPYGCIPFHPIDGAETRSFRAGRKRRSLVVKILWNKHLNRMIVGWSFYQLQQFVKYKAAICGISVEFVSPQYTSQTCHQC